ncbi:hypothetical protein PACTADRAFT_49342 [Pachysolen tannophilus NRRL Y-2460]|uniref:Cytochrome b5 heme-binding domain-containing protein n=1 Tax=Pachysolen tannophilus NRRL Y-2460 TaxID=669874 RepID=A0A1E4TVW1_PACTA|nr:hypothetical protein PACTADRAFT_49342 [Pachysolen tannophilus NRRL Y-2460]
MSNNEINSDRKPVGMSINDLRGGPNVRSQLRKPPASSLTIGSSSSNNSRGRQKVVLKPGHSALDWATMKRTNKNLAGSCGYPLKISKEEVQKHNKLDDFWIVINRKVFNLTPYLDFHPGGIDILKQCAGKDGTALFNKYHPWINCDRILDSCFLGYLV